MRGLFCGEMSISVIRDPSVLLTFLKTFGFNQAYLYFYLTHIKGSPSLVSGMVKQFHNSKIEAWGVINQGGFSPSNLPTIDGTIPNYGYSNRQLIDAYASYTGEKFDGLMFDIEDLKGLGDYFAPQLDNITWTGRKGVYIDPPAYLGNSRELYKRFDLILLNTYRPTAQGIIDTAEDGPELCNELMLPYLIGLEALPGWENSFDGTHPTYSSFIHQIDAHFNPDRMYLGTYLDAYQYVKNWEANTKTITMNGAQTVTANFIQDEYPLVINTIGQGTVQKSPDQLTYKHGIDVTLTAVPSPGWRFGGWS